MLKFNFGAMAPTLEEQANRKGYTLGEEAEKMEKLRRARAMLYLHGIISESVSSDIIAKIGRKAEEVLKPLELGGAKEGA